MFHWIRHLLGWHPCTLLRVIHAIGCDGDCLLSWPERLVCNHWIELQCQICGKIETL